MTPRSRFAVNPAEQASKEGFYVTARNGSRLWSPLLGPYDDKQTAEANVDRARKHAEGLDKWAHFYEFGTGKITAINLPDGILNRSIGLRPGEGRHVD